MGGGYSIPASRVKQIALPELISMNPEFPTLRSATERPIEVEPLYMMRLAGCRGSTLRDYRPLLGQADFRLVRVALPSALQIQL
jgi:hypothetical protein